MTIAVIPKGTVWAVDEIKTFTVNLGSVCIDKGEDLVYGFRFSPIFIGIPGGSGRFGLASIAGITGAGPALRIENVNSGLTYPTIQTAVSDASAGDTIEIHSGTYVGYQVWATANRNNLTIRGVGPTRPVLDADNNASDSKGVLVIDGNDCTIDNLEICNGRSGYAQNIGAVRAEGTNITVSHCYLHDCDNGILANNVSASNTVLEYTEFDHNGHGGGQTHNIYIGHSDTLIMRYCYSHDTVDGHELKTRPHQLHPLQSPGQ